LFAAGFSPPPRQRHVCFTPLPTFSTAMPNTPYAPILLSLMPSDRRCRRCHADITLCCQMPFHFIPFLRHCQFAVCHARRHLLRARPPLSLRHEFRHARHAFHADDYARAEYYFPLLFAISAIR
jgi:hypothetical protein